MILFRQSATLEENRQKAMKLKTEMEIGMENWSEKVLTAQEENIKRAEEKVEKEKIEKKQKGGEERKTREKKVLEKQRQSKDYIEEIMKEKRKTIERKNKRVRR
jgi:hypothetical protein